MPQRNVNDIGLKALGVNFSDGFPIVVIDFGAPSSPPHKAVAPCVLQVPLDAMS